VSVRKWNTYPMIGKWTRIEAGRTVTVVGRADSFNPEEPRSSLFRSYRPSLREERLLRSTAAMLLPPFKLPIAACQTD
jgi:hypothetical protein